MLNKESVFLHLLIISINIFLCFAITCRDESGRSVDWFIVYKIPKLETRRDALKNGLSYAFVTSDTSTASWTLSKKLISDPSSLFGSTVTPLFSSNGITKILYSDQTPDGKTYSVNAHSKGVLAMDNESGFWLTHSVPKYPTPFGQPYKYPGSGADNGQTALCISFSTAREGEKVVNHLLVSKPKIYSSHFDKKVTDLVSNLEDLKNSKWSKNDFTRSTIKSLNNEKFIAFAKNSRLIDLYKEHISPYIKSGLLVESWRKGSGTKIESTCKTPKIINVESVNLNFGRGNRSGDFSYKKDHSKWLISEEEKKSFVCIADLNRMMSQNKRGGGAVCIHNIGVWNLFRDSIAGLETCGRT